MVLPPPCVRDANVSLLVCVPLTLMLIVEPPVISAKTPAVSLDAAVPLTM